MNNSIIYNNCKYIPYICKENKIQTPFHNDIFMMTIILDILKKSDIFIETGVCMGYTLFFVAKNFPHLKCYSCEILDWCYDIANEYIKDLNNVKLDFVASPQALYNIKDKYDCNIFDKRVCFWLDAHGNSYEPLYDEISYITSNYNNFTIFIDDFAIPWDDRFTNDGYTIEKIKPLINNKEKLKFYMPAYSSYLPECNNCNNVGCPPVGYIILTNQEINTFDLLKEIDI